MIMMIRVCGVLLLLAAVSALAQAGPDLILLNGKVFTADKTIPTSQAVAIRGNRIHSVGTDAAIRRLAGSRTRVIDLAGRIVVPGFNDAHAHFDPMFQGLELKLEFPEPSWVETSAALEKAVAASSGGKWIFGTIGGAVINEPAADREALDRIAPRNPVFLLTYFGHGAIFNSAAMKALGLSEDERDPMGGHFERDKRSKKLNGRVFEYAQWRLMRLLSEEGSDEQLIAELKERAAEAASHGITSMQIMPGISTTRFIRLVQAARLPIRVRVIAFPNTTIEGRDLRDFKVIASFRPGKQNVTASGVKWILDGTPIERGAAMRKAYLDRPDWKGVLNFSEAEIERIVRESLHYRHPLLAHAVGDRAVEALLDAIEKVGAGKVDWTSKRVRIEHGEGVADDLIVRAKNLGVVVVQNPSHFAVVNEIYTRWGKDTKFSSQRSLIDAGLHYAIGSDGPINPFLNIMFATVHPARPAEAITREQAVVAYTAGSAFAEFAEKEKGTITKGKLADLAVLSQDIFSVPVEALPATSSVLTIVGGRIVHDAGILK